MKLTTILNDDQLRAIFNRVNADYRDNLTLSSSCHLRRDKRWQHQFTLATRSSFAYGARTSASGRHMPKASWQAHRDVLAAIFAADPEAKLVSALATYRGRVGFERDFPATAHTNVGSQMRPRAIQDCAVPA